MHGGVCGGVHGRVPMVFIVLLPLATIGLVGDVTVPLGLWMFERPGELRLNHSNVIFNYFY